MSNRGAVLIGLAWCAAAVGCADAITSDAEAVDAATADPAAADAAAADAAAPDAAAADAATADAATADAATAATDASIAGEPHVEPKRWVLYTGTEDVYPDGMPPPDKVRLLLADLDAGAIDPSKPLLFLDAPSMDPLWWSSDGAWLAGTGSGARLRLWDMRGQWPVEMPPISDERVRSIQPSPATASFVISTLGAWPCNFRGACSEFYLLNLAQPGGPKLTQLDWMSNSDLVMMSPDGTSFIGSETDPDTGNSNYFLIDLSARARATRQLLASAASYSFTPEAWSPDGRWFAIENADAREQGGLFLLDLMSSDPAPAVTPFRAKPARDLQAPSYFLGWSPDGAWLLIRRIVEDEPETFEVQLVDMRGASPGEPIALPWRFSWKDGRNLEAVVWSPDARRFVLSIAGTHPLEWLVFDATSPQQAPLWHGTAPAQVFVTWTAAGSLLFQGGATFFVHTLAEGSEPEAVAVEVSGATLISPDRRRLVYRTSTAGSGLRLLEFEGGLQDLPLAFHGEPVAMQWLSDASGLVAFTSPTDPVTGVPPFSFYNCQLEYLLLRADAVLQRPHRLSGQAHAPNFLVQPAP